MYDGPKKPTSKAAVRYERIHIKHVTRSNPEHKECSINASVNMIPGKRKS